MVGFRRCRVSDICYWDVAKRHIEITAHPVSPACSRSNDFFRLGLLPPGSLW
jgi:hypothetical protein